MPPPDPLGVVSWLPVIEMIGALVIFGFVLAAAISILRRRPIVSARLLVADGVILGLSFKLSATLLRTIELRTWKQLGLFAAILAIRLFIKRLFLWERSRLRPASPAAGPNGS